MESTNWTYALDQVAESCNKLSGDLATTYVPLTPLHELPQRLSRKDKGEDTDDLWISHVKGAEEHPLLTSTIGGWFEHSVQQYGHKPVLTILDQNIRWSWLELKQQVDGFAAGLIELGYQKGDRLGVWMPNNYQWVVAQLTTAKLGIILVSLNPAYRIYELEHSLQQVGVKGLLLTPTHKRSDYIALAHELIPDLATMDARDIQSTRVPSLKHIIHASSKQIAGMMRFEDVVKTLKEDDVVHKEIADRLASTSKRDPINIQFTSGTTGLPKGATLTHEGLLNNGYFIGLRMKLTEADVVCIPVPLYHCFGLVLGNLAALCHGSRIVYPASSFDPLSVLQAVDSEKCTALHGVPTMFIAELEHPEFKKFDMSSLRTGIMAGSTCPIEVMKRVIHEMNMKEITICYGMTETSPVSWQSEADCELDRRVETVGQIHPHLECKIVDEEGCTVPVGKIGELRTKGYSVMLGYWNDEEKTKQTVDQGGWMHTGDLAEMDKQGYCRIVGRSKDMIIRGGENIYPREIEEFLHTMPGVEDVAVFGVPDRVFGEQVGVWIKRKDSDAGRALTTESVQAFCKGTIAHYKVPFYVLFKDSFPMTVTGKVQKYIIRDITLQELAEKQKSGQK